MEHDKFSLWSFVCVCVVSTVCSSVTQSWGSNHSGPAVIHFHFCCKYRHKHWHYWLMSVASICPPRYDENFSSPCYLSRCRCTDVFLLNIQVYPTFPLGKKIKLQACFSDPLALDHLELLHLSQAASSSCLVLLLVWVYQHLSGSTFQPSVSQ